MTPVSLLSAILSLALHIVIAEVTEAEQVQDSLDAYMNLDQVETVEGFMRTREFKVSCSEHGAGHQHKSVFLMSCCCLSPLCCPVHSLGTE